MASLATISLEVTVEDANGVAISRPLGKPSSIRFAPGAGIDGQLNTVTLTGSAFTALTVPTGAKALLLELPTTATSLTLKGIAGDTGISLTPSSNFGGIPVLIPLGSTPSIGILNGGSTVQVQCVWL